MNLKTRDLVLVAMFAALTAIGAFITIPLPIVPFTLQYFFCALGAILLGAKRGMLAQVLYVGIGLIGVPVFTRGGGPQYIFQPTFGYLIGFIVAAYIIGRISQEMKELNIRRIFMACLFGIGAIYLFGCIHMYVIFNFYLGQVMSVWKVISVGIIACLASDLLLTLIISIVGARVVPLLRKLGYAS